MYEIWYIGNMLIWKWVRLKKTLGDAGGASERILFWKAVSVELFEVKYFTPNIFASVESKQIFKSYSIQPLAWRILWMEEPGGLLSIGSHRVRHDWSDFACMHALEKAVAAHYSVLACRIPGTEEPGGLPSVGSPSQTWLKRLSSSSVKVHAFSK